VESVNYICEGELEGHSPQKLRNAADRYVRGDALDGGDAGDIQVTQESKAGCLCGQRWTDNRQVVDSIAVL
jgi:hypothetical protein